MEMKKYEVQFCAGPSRNKEAVWHNGSLESPGVDYMLATIEVDGEEIELYAECGEDDVENGERFWNDGEWDDVGFGEVSYPILKEEILRQAAENGIPADSLKFWWD